MSTDIRGHEAQHHHHLLSFLYLLLLFFVSHCEGNQVCNQTKINHVIQTLLEQLKLELCDTFGAVKVRTV